MARNTADVVVRLLAKDEGLKKALSEAGPAGEKALKQIERAGKPAKSSLKGVDAVASEVKSSIGQMTDRLGPAGSGLRALGPFGAAAAIGLGAVVAASAAAAKAGAEAADALARIGDEADQLGLAAEEYQALQFAAKGLRIEQAALSGALATFKKITDEAALGTGEFFSSMKLLNPELVEQVARTDDLSARLALVKSAFAAASSETERNTILVRTFGDSGAEAGRALLQMEGSLGDLTDTARRSGIVFSEDLIRSAQEASAVIEQADARVAASKLRLKSAFVEFAVDAKNSQAFLFNQIASFGGADALEEQIFKLEQQRARLLAGVASNSPVLRAIFGTNFENRMEKNKALLDDLYAQLDARENADPFEFDMRGLLGGDDPAVPTATADLQAAINRLRGEAVTASERQAEALAELDAGRRTGLITTEEEYQRLRRVIIEKFKDVDAIRAQAKAASDAKAAAAELARQQAEAVRIRADLGDITGVLSKRQTELNDLVAAGVLDQDSANAAMIKFRETLDGTAEARAELTRAIAESFDPIEKFKIQTQELEAAQALANIPAEDFNRLLEVRAQKLADLEKAKSDAAEKDEFGETLDAAEDRILDSLKTAEEIITEKLATERKIVEALVSGGSLTSGQMTEYLTEYETELRKTVDTTDAMSAAQEVLDGILNGSIDSFEDLGRVGLRVLTDLLTSSQSVQNGIGNLFSGLFGGGGPGTVSAGVAHDGRASVGSGGPRRQVPISAFLGAPRAHSGKSAIGRDEYPFILQKDERVLSAVDNRAIVAAMQRPAMVSAPSPINFTLIDQVGVKKTTEDRQGPNGERELRVTLSKMIESGSLAALQSPQGAKVMKSAYGVRQKLGTA